MNPTFARHSIANVKRLFFDRQAVLNAVDQATRRVLSRFGAFTRRIAKNSIRQRRGTSAPGTPPFSHTGLLRKFLFFAYDPSARSVIIGPARLRGRGYGEAPALLEYGGAGERSFLAKTGSTVPGQGLAWRRKHVHIRPRPYMGPAFVKAKENLPDMWANSVKP